MKINLQYQSQAQGSMEAAFLRGSTLADWLPELERWGLPILDLQAYVVPTSLADRHPVGLLVVLPAQAKPIAWAECVPCYLHAKQLALPCDASLQPAMTEDELARSLRFPIQFLHPTFGLVGWELQERLDFGKLLTFAPETKQAWQHAHPGNAPAPALNDVKVPQPSMADMMQTLKEGVDPKSLPDDAAGAQDDSTWGRFKAGIFKGGLSMTNGLLGSLPEGDGKGGSGFEALSGLADWLSGKVNSLQGQRLSAIDKLLDMFDKNMDDALRYAIPLGDPFASRGIGSATGSLSERDTSFNLGGLGGGTGGNAWEIDMKRQQMLRELYLKAVQDALARGDYEKAAYIYAHLLRDFNGAANALAQGKMYREAAAIYKEHLKNLPMAAECLEKGGLLLDAIDIYLQLERWEKAGDLYSVIGKRARAEVQYERCVQASLEKADFLEASRILLHRMDDDVRARVVLLQGWAGSQQQEACLTRYFESILGDPGVDTGVALDDLYRKHTTTEQRGSFLTVLTTHFPQLPEGRPTELARGFAYEIVSEEALRGKKTHMALLPKFVPRDGLLTSDVSRYQALKPKTIPAPTPEPKLNHNIVWKGCIAMEDQYLAHGQEGSHLWLARFNFQGHVEYYHWPETVVTDRPVRLIGRTGNHGRALIYQSGVDLSKKSLPANERFSFFVEVSSPNWLAPDWAVVAGLGLDAQGWLWTMVQGAGSTSLKRYEPAGQLSLEKYLKWPDGSLFEIEPMADWSVLHPYKDGFVMRHPMGVIYIDEKQVVHVIDFSFPTIDIIINRYGSGCIVATHGGTFWIFPEKVGTPGGNPSPVGKAGAAHLLLEVLPGGLLVVTTTQDEVEVYALHDQGHLEMRSEIGFEPVAIIPGPYRRTFALVSAQGDVKRFDVEDRIDHWL